MLVAAMCYTNKLCDSHSFCLGLPGPLTARFQSPIASVLAVRAITAISVIMTKNNMMSKMMSVLILAGIGLIFSVIASMELCFGFVLKTAWITQGCFSY